MKVFCRFDSQKGVGGSVPVPLLLFSGSKEEKQALLRIHSKKCQINPNKSLVLMFYLFKDGST